MVYCCLTIVNKTTAVPKLKKSNQTIVNQHFITSVFLFSISVIYGCSTKSVQEESVDDNDFLNSIIITRSVVDFTLVLESDSMSRSLAFYKNKDSSIFHHFNYQFQPEKEINLSAELEYIDKLWTAAKDSIEIDLTSIMVGYPLEYKDVLSNQIVAFRDSPEWNTNEDKLKDYDLMRKIMMQNNVYRPLDSLLRLKGISIIGFSTEKHGFVPKEELEALGFDSEMNVPVPFMVWINVKQSI